MAAANKNHTTAFEICKDDLFNGFFDQFNESDLMEQFDKRNEVSEDTQVLLINMVKEAYYSGFDAVMTAAGISEVC